MSLKTSLKQEWAMKAASPSRKANAPTSASMWSRKIQTGTNLPGDRTNEFLQDSRAGTD